MACGVRPGIVNGDGAAPHICDPQRPGDLILGVRREHGSPAELIGQAREIGLPGLEAVGEQARLDDVVSAEGDVGDRFDESGRPLPRELDLPMADGDYDFRLLHVPEGEEQLAAGSLIRLFMTLTGVQAGFGAPTPIIAQPNHILGFDAGPAPVSLSADHDRYLEEMGIERPATPTSHPRVRIIDSGCNDGRSVVLERNLLDPARDGNVDDDDGHGSLVAAIIDDITYGPVEIFKVADAARAPTEWEVLQALSTPPMPPIVNLSMSLGFGNRYCAKCGRRPVGARTAVFGERLRELHEAGVIVVAAAGNSERHELAYPSRFASAVAVEACSGHPPKLAGYSNRGTTDEVGARHQNVFMCPGGDRNAAEGPALERSGSGAFGTSFAAAYMSGLLASEWAKLSICTDACVICRDMVLDSARSVAERGFEGYDQGTHGNGLARFG